MIAITTVVIIQIKRSFFVGVDTVTPSEGKACLMFFCYEFSGK